MQIFASTITKYNDLNMYEKHKNFIRKHKIMTMNNIIKITINEHNEKAMALKCWNFE